MAKPNIRSGNQKVEEVMKEAEEQQQQQEAVKAAEVTEQQEAATGQEAGEENVPEVAAQEGEEELLITPVEQKAEVVESTPTPPPAVEEKKEEVKAKVEEAMIPAASPLTEALNNILKNVPPANRVAINRIVTYLSVMAPRRPVNQKTINTEQVAFYKAIQTIINRQEDYFRPLFTALLYILKTESKGAMGDRYRMRGMESIVLPARDRTAFVNLTQAFCILADAKSREITMKQVNLERALANGLTPEGRDRVLAYFNA